MKTSGFWANQVMTHAAVCAPADPAEQIHFGSLFLPWHRAFLMAIESVFQRRLSDPDFALPYWDWEVHRRLPPGFIDQATPLFDATRAPGQADVLEDAFVDISGPMAASSFESFRNQLEFGAHTNVHGWVSGNMGAFDTAGLDPLFLLHHANLDRIWHRWASLAARTYPSTPEFLKRRLSFFSGEDKFTIVVNDILENSSLPYEYAAGTVMTMQSPAKGIRLGTEPVTTETIPLSADMLEAVTKRGGRIVLSFDFVGPPADAEVLNVFLNDGRATVDTPAAGPNFAGRISLIPLRRGVASQYPITVELDVTRQIQQLPDGSKGVAVRFVPLETRSRTLADAPSITISNIVFRSR